MFFLIFLLFAQSWATPSNESMYGQIVETCSAKSFIADIISTGDDLPSEAYAFKPARSNTDCTLMCLKDKARCTEAFYDEVSEVCHLSSAQLSKPKPSTEKGKRKGNCNTRTVMRPKAYGKTTPDPGCNSTTCAKGSDTCRKDCLTNDTLCSGNLDGCNEVSVSNIRHYYFGNFDPQHDGTVLSVTYKKQYAFTALRLQFRGVLGTPYGNFNDNDPCSRWSFTINGEECLKPGPIETKWISASSVHRMRYQSGRVDGVCEDVPAGNLSIEFRVSPCFTGTYSSTGITTSDIQASVTVEENDLRFTSGSNSAVLQTYGGSANQSACFFPFIYNGLSYTDCTQAGYDSLWCATTANYDADGLWGKCPGSCPGLSRFNIKHHTWSSNSSVNWGELWSTEYYKRASDTSIHALFLGILGVEGHGTTKWTIFFNGETCTDPGVVDGVIGHDNAAVTYKTHDGSNGIEGMCNNIPAGKVTISLHVFKGGDSVPHTSSSRFIIEEIRLNQDTAAVTGMDGNLHRVPEFNIRHWSWDSERDEKLNGSYAFSNITYTKKSSVSYIRVYYQGALRQLKQAAGWYFTFNGVECSDPGTVRGIIKQNDIDDDQHHVTIVDGFCKLPAGVIKIEFNILTISSLSNEAMACSNSVCRIVVSEVFLAN